jgi:hypothetical protein
LTHKEQVQDEERMRHVPIHPGEQALVEIMRQDRQAHDRIRSSLSEAVAAPESHRRPESVACKKRLCARGVQQGPSWTDEL